MKKVVIVCIVFYSVVFSTIAQDTVHTLLKLKLPKTLGLYIAPEFSFGQLSSSFTPLAGASAMLLIDKRFALGVTAQTSIDRNFSPTNVAPLFLKSRFEAIKLEYTFNPDAAIHISFPLTIGMGSASLDSSNGKSFPRDSLDNHFGRNDKKDKGFESNIFVIQPGLNIEGNIIKYVKMFVGVSYRIAINTNNNSVVNAVNTSTLQGLSINLGLKVGLFDFSLRKKKVE
jgi:hypothetical protein